MNKILKPVGLLLLLLAFSCEKNSGTAGGEGGKSDKFSVTISLPQNAGKAAWTKSDRIRLYIQDGSLSAPSVTLSSEGEGTSATFSAMGADRSPRDPFRGGHRHIGNVHGNEPRSEAPESSSQIGPDAAGFTVPRTGGNEAHGINHPSRILR